MKSIVVQDSASCTDVAPRQATRPRTSVIHVRCDRKFTVFVASHPQHRKWSSSLRNVSFASALHACCNSVIWLISAAPLDQSVLGSVNNVSQNVRGGPVFPPDGNKARTPQPMEDAADEFGFWEGRGGRGGGVTPSFQTQTPQKKDKKKESESGGEGRGGGGKPKPQTCY